MIASGSPAGTVVQELRHVGASRTADLLQVTARSLWDSDKNTFAKSAAQAPAWMRATLLSNADLAPGDHLG